MNRVLAFTVIYPQAERYKYDFIDCLGKQTFKDFDVLVVNDGCDSHILSKNFENFHTIILDTNLSPSKNREVGIQYAYNNNYETLIFCDIDDWFLPKRFEISLKRLDKKDIVVNNLNIVGENREYLCERYFSYSINEDTVIDAAFLKNKNLLGLSNTAIKVQNKCIVELPSGLSIGDWYYFAICAERGLSITYCDDALTDYRQHGNNLIGIDNFSIELFRKLIKLKIEHYDYLCKIYPSYESLLEESKELEHITNDVIISLIKKNKEINAHPLWWENIKK